MDPFSSTVPVLGVAFICFLVWFALLPLWMYMRIRGMEHALWAIVSQLKLLRPSEPLDAVQQSLRDRAVQNVKTEVRGGAEHISNSAFGR